MFKISGFIDEISPEFEEQLEVAKQIGMNYVELRSAWDINILDLDIEKLEKMKGLLKKYDLKVSCIGSPIGKVFLDEDFPAHMKRFEHGLELAHFFGCHYIRVFSFYSKDNIYDHKDEVIKRLKMMLVKAEEQKVIMLHENEEGIYGHTSKRCLELAEALASPCFSLVEDPANYCLAGEKPFEESYQVVGKHVGYIHVKDYSCEKKTMVLAGTGDGQFNQLLPALKDKDIFLTLEPHLDVAGQFRGFTGPVKFGEAYQSLVGILKKNNLEYI